MDISRSDADSNQNHKENNEAFMKNGFEWNCRCDYYPVLFRLQPGNHHYADLAQLVGEDSTPDERIRQNLAIEAYLDSEFKTLQTNFSQSYGDSWATPTPSHAGITRYARLFDKLLFFGAFQMQTTTQRCFILLLQPDFLNNGPAMGFTESLTLCDKHDQIHRVLVTLDPGDPKITSTPLERSKAILGALLHELCHAFLLIYARKCHLPDQERPSLCGLGCHSVACQALLPTIARKAVLEHGFDLAWSPLLGLSE